VSNKRPARNSRSFHDPKIGFKNPSMFRDAGREYEVSLRDGTKGRLGFALGDLALDNAFTSHARSLNALGFGIISFAGLPGAPQRSMLWTQTPTETVMTLADGDRQPESELQHLIAKYIAIYFSDIAAIAPELGEPRVRPMDTHVPLPQVGERRKN
jgi:hypothetical protein